MAQLKTRLYCRGIEFELPWETEPELRAGEAFLEEIAGPSALDFDGLRYFFLKAEDQLEALYDFWGLQRVRAGRPSRLTREDEG